MEVGDTIELVWTSDPYTHLYPGMWGVVTYVPKMTELNRDFPVAIGVKWEDGSTLGLIEGEDRWRTIKEAGDE